MIRLLPSTRPELLVVCHTAPFLLADLEKEYTLHNLFLAEDKEALLAEVGDRIRGILAGGMQGPDAALINRLPKLEIIASNSVGFDATDVAAANARGVPVTHTPDVLTDDVADLGMAFIIMAPRRIAESERFLRAGKWPQGRMDLGPNASSTSALTSLRVLSPPWQETNRISLSAAISSRLL